MQGQNIFLQPTSLAEFYRATTKKRRFVAAEAASFVRQFQLSMRIVPYEADDVIAAMHVHNQDGFQFFDALMVCTARRAGCHTFLTEDMQNDRTLDAITIRNPFLLPPADLDLLLGINKDSLTNL